MVMLMMVGHGVWAALWVSAGAGVLRWYTERGVEAKAVERMKKAAP